MGRLLTCVTAIICLIVCINIATAKLNVHIVPHTHDDVGWLKTVDQYFMGANNSIQHAGVQYILDTVTLALAEDPSRKFVYVEQAFFQRWWRQQTADTQALVKKFVANGQLEFINGGWCMHDEAATHYIAMVDQTTTGHRFLKDQFNVQPRIGWQIDPFGHSSTQAALLSAEVGFDALYFGRIDYQDAQGRMKRSGMEFVWRASPSLGADAQVFTGAFQSGNYGPPDEFCFDQFCDDLPIQDDKNIEDYNVQNRVDLFVKRVTDQASHTKGNDIMLTMGSDFQYENARAWFKNLDKLIKYVNADGRVNVFYSTASQYTAAKLAAGIQWEVKTDDFFPYADNEHSYWTGYFTSRPSLKKYVRVASSYLNAARQFEVLFKRDGTETWALEEANGLAQHHDAVSGTSKQHVAFDYAQRLSRGWAQAETMINSIWAAQNGSVNVVQCQLLNISLCSITASGSRLRVNVYNQLAHARTDFVSLPISNTNLVVFEADNKTPRLSQIVPRALSADSSAPSYAIVFPVSVGPTSGQVYYVRAATLEEQQSKISAEAVTPAKRVSSRVGAPVYIENDFYVITYDGGYLKSITNKRSKITTLITQRWYWYKSSAEKNSNPSGAYIFRPNVTDPIPVSNAPPTLNIVTGPAVSEVRQVISPWLSQTTRLYAGQSNIEVEYQVGAIPFDDGFGKEIITRFTSDIKSAQLFYTDSNGREVLERKINYRPSWQLNVTEPVAGNYYPMNVAAYIRDSQTQLTVLTDRSQGVASLADGQLEVMVHRRILADDWRGVGEPLNETESITPYPDPQRRGLGLSIVGRHWFIFDTPATSARQWRPLSSRIFAAPLLGFSQISDEANVMPAEQWTRVRGGQLPDNVELMTLQVLTSQPGSTLVRLAHLYGVGDDDTLSKPANVSLTSLFPGFTISNVVELSLTANQKRSAMSPLPSLHIVGEPYHKNVTRKRSEAAPQYNVHTGDVTVVVGVAEIRTYSLTLSS